jgi:hypothetical protein
LLQRSPDTIRRSICGSHRMDLDARKLDADQVAAMLHNSFSALQLGRSIGCRETIS